jgi:hypothetical protein
MVWVAADRLLPSSMYKEDKQLINKDKQIHAKALDPDDFAISAEFIGAYLPNSAPYIAAIYNPRRDPQQAQYLVQVTNSSGFMKSLGVRHCLRS